MEILPITQQNRQDLLLPNEPFSMPGRFIPELRDGTWSYRIEWFEKTRTMTFPDEAYQFGELSQNGIAFGAYNKRFPGEGSKAWLTTVAEQRDKYVADPLSGFDFTVSAMKDLMILNRDSNSAETTEKTPKDMPMLLVSGEDDPVGEYGRGVEAACERYKAAGCRAEMKLYKGARHEILNDFTYDDVKNDIIKFIEE